MHPGNGRSNFTLPACHRAVLRKVDAAGRLLENGETVAAGAKRETFEEARARVEISAPYALYNICHVDQIYLLFRARLNDKRFQAGNESLEVRLFNENDIPWEEIAFQVINATLLQYFDDRRSGRFSFFVGSIANP